jgi:SAM-dependent methyltransferase
MQYAYDANFMTYADRSSRHSARVISNLLCQALKIESVLDIGCARGTWLSAWREQGAKNIFGVDGSYVSTNNLAIPRQCFFATDLAHQFDLRRKFDLVQSLEVAEHIPGTSADIFVKNLVRHSSGIILFSAAPPGQGGEFHVNEQPYEYWRQKFRAHDFDAFDCVRPLIANDKAVSFWYRYNALLYVRVDRVPVLPESIRATRMPTQTAIPDIAPGWFRWRKRLTRLLPFTISQQLAHAMARWRGR